MTRITRLAIVTLLVGLPTGLLGRADAAPPQRRPYLAYMCAAGGKQGATVRIIVGGQNLRGTRRVLVTGEGVQGKVIRHGRSSAFIRTEVRRELAQRLRRLAARKVRAMSGDTRRRPPPRSRPGKKGKNRTDAAKKRGGKAKSDKPAAPPVELPDHPLLRDLESLSLKELRKVMYEFLDPAHRAQTSSQIAEIVELEVTIAPDAIAGDRELRLGGGRGLSNPLLFMVGTLPEFSEQEPNDFETSKQQVLDLPVVVNGQVSFKDMDRFRFRAEAGQKLVIETQARRLVPYLADAVPGWFQATLALYDAHGTEIDYGDDFRFDPDPVLYFEVPEDGVYELAIRDAIDRGREDFVYRITIAERPYVTSIFPLGGRVGELTTPAVRGWNLPWDNVLLDTLPGDESIRRSAWSRDGLRTNDVPYAVDDLPECFETEPNDSPGSAHAITLPRIVNGRIARAGDSDVFRFTGGAGEEIVAEVHARRLGSPLDSVLRLTDATGRVIAWNDDEPDRRAGLVTHQADSYLRTKLPADGVYCISVTDAQGHGGLDHAYRLRIGPRMPDFTVIVTPSSLTVDGGSRSPVTVHVVRTDGFEGDIELNLKNAPVGFALSGSRIPAGRDCVRMTLSAPGKIAGGPIPLEIQARGRHGSRTMVRRVVPAQNMMQAFGLRHLVASQVLLVDVPKARWRRPPIRVDSAGPVLIPKGGTAEVRVLAAGLTQLDKIDLVLAEPPASVTLREVVPMQGGAILVLAADAEKAEVGYADNLIVEAYAKALVKPRGGKGKAKDRAKKPGKKKPGTRKAPQQFRRTYAGVLPAIPFVIVRR